MFGGSGVPSQLGGAVSAASFVKAGEVRDMAALENRICATEKELQGIKECLTNVNDRAFGVSNPAANGVEIGRQQSELMPNGYVAILNSRLAGVDRVVGEIRHLANRLDSL